MYNIMHNSKAGMLSSQSNIELISNNITNVQTVGYKKLDAGFLDLYQESLHKNSYPTNSPDIRTGTGSRISQATRNYEQGAIKETKINTNLAIDGNGFFRVIRSDGSYAYTRNGEFNLDSTGKLVDDKGNVLDIQPINGNVKNINLKNGDLSINKNGEIYLDKNKVGEINLYQPKGDVDFTSVGDNLFTAKPVNVEVVQNKSILQGHVEMSNVNMQDEMVNLIMAQRSFQYNSKGIQVGDDMWSMVNNLQSR
ncbi:flagellar hook-basal body family protein [[Clostridium] bifermentans ATCC 638]|uniref:Flagellar hook-basal body family protein n=1 Tax=Paraclostridium bifermentans ATCC 638 = DSM 14991 TaxID=1233171 RepID=T4VIT6_PARBF|nr:flagellar hook-basal body complex protein [Paraclostridium bifermentans]EQK43609.1 flagellar hook-basal body family protein [[Clostridium] bifermentans ATCC 638] [Paraclostridium bifermentans ATCC 638 = DSM 14991]RIZ59684.1 flagellar biosynthesis protein FlgG [Paraclostridium bifermentans]UAG17454.1 flagellar basal body rod protein FlgG [Paraclostridium bifermentans]